MEFQKSDMPSEADVFGSVTDEVWRSKNWIKHRTGLNGREEIYPHAADFEHLDGQLFTRTHVFDDFKVSIPKGVISTIKWGYPKGGRPGGPWLSFSNAFRTTDKFEAIIVDLKAEKASAEKVLKKLNGIVSGVGTATTSKIAYFAQLESEEGPCLIYDSMVRRAIVFSTDPALDEVRRELVRYKRDIAPPIQEATYGAYIRSVGKLADRLNVSPAQVELALFRYGRKQPAIGTVI